MENYYFNDDYDDYDLEDEEPERLETKLLEGYKIVLGWTIDQEKKTYRCDVGLLLDECLRGSWQLPSWAGLIFPDPEKVSFDEIQKIFDDLVKNNKAELIEASNSFYRGLDEEGLLNRLRDGMGLYLASYRYLERLGGPLSMDACAVWQEFCKPRYPYWSALWAKERNHCPAETARMLSCAEKNAFTRWLELPSLD